MKIAVSGKGGVGKTLLSAFLARAFAAGGYKVIAIDADPDANLGATLGFPDAGKIVPISHLKDLVRQRTGAQESAGGLYFTLNPKVDDLPDEIFEMGNRNDFPGVWKAESRSQIGIGIGIDSDDFIPAGRKGPRQKGTQECLAHAALAADRNLHHPRSPPSMKSMDL